MSELERLLAELCPDGVEFRALGDVGRLVRGNGMPKTNFTDSGVGAIHYGQIYTHYGTWATETISCVAPETAERLAKVEPGDLIITNTSENQADVGKAVAWLGPETIVTGGHATVLKHDQDPKFISYWLQCPSFQRQKRRLANGTKVIDVSARNLATVRIPVPPLEVQRAIVAILDKMEALEAELDAELEARRRQYAHYRDTLLTFDEASRVPWVAMVDVLELRAGKFIAAREIVPDGDENHRYPCFGGNGRRGYVSAPNHDSHHVLIGRQGAWSGNVKRVSGRFYATEHAVVVSPKIAVNTSWVFHLLTAMDLNRFVSQGAQPGLAVGTLNQLRIPLPPLSEQERAAQILDSFDALVNDLSSGLPAEIAARRKQYEYYRDRLLSFAELAA